MRREKLLAAVAGAAMLGGLLAAGPAHAIGSCTGVNPPPECQGTSPNADPDEAGTFVPTQPLNDPWNVQAKAPVYADDEPGPEYGLNYGGSSVYTGPPIVDATHDNSDDVAANLDEDDVSKLPPGPIPDRMAGCEMVGNPGTRLDIRKDTFAWGKAYMLLGFYGEADFKIVLSTRYYYCRKVLPGDKIMPIDMKICATKMDAQTPIISDPPFTKFIRRFRTFPVWGQTLNHDPNRDIQFADYQDIHWEGIGPKDHKVCTKWVNLPPDLPIFDGTHWILDSNQPEVEAFGHVDIAHAKDTKYSIREGGPGGSELHNFRPWFDPIIKGAGSGS